MTLCIPYHTALNSTSLSTNQRYCTYCTFSSLLCFFALCSVSCCEFLLYPHYLIFFCLSLSSLASLPSSPHLTLPHPTLPYVTLFHSSVRSDYTFNACLFPNLTRLLIHNPSSSISLSHPSPHPYVPSFVLLPLFLILFLFLITLLPPPIHLTFPTPSCTPHPTSPLTHHPNLHHPSPNLTPYPAPLLHPSGS